MGLANEQMWKEHCELHAKEKAELSALRALRDAVGKYIAGNDGSDYHAMVMAYEKCEATNDGK